VSGGLARILLVAALSVVLAAAAASVAGGAQPVTSVRVMHTPSLLYLPFYVADAKGFLTRRGIKIANYTQTGNPAPALISGDADIALIGASQAIISAAQGKPTRLIGMMQQVNAMYLVVRADKAAGEKPYPLNVRDMRGFVIGTTARVSGGEIFMTGVLEGAGLKEGPDYSIVALGTPANEIAALQAKRIDAAMMFPPFVNQAIKDGLVKPVVQAALGQGPKEISNQYGASVIGAPKFLSAHPAAVKAIADAVAEGDAYVANYKAHLNELINIAVKYTGITDRSVLAAAIPTVARLSKPYFTCATAGSMAKLFIKLGLIDNLPGCGDIAQLKVLPKQPLAKKR
jgi:NitT/TauT family transport system substrate-binding protein